MRMVSLCPSLTELVFELGAGEALIGVTRWCLHPADGVEPLEKLGGTKNPEVERIVALAPDLVLLNREENRREDAEALAAAGIPCHATQPRNPTEAARMVRSVGNAIDRCAEAEKLARRIERRVAETRERVAERPRVPFACLVWRKPWMVAGDDTYLHSLLEEGGGFNVFAGQGDRYRAIEPGGLAAASPSLVVLPSEPFPFAERHIDELATATGLSRAVFRLADGELLSWHGVRTPQGLDHALALVETARRTQSSIGSMAEVAHSPDVAR